MTQAFSRVLIPSLEQAEVEDDSDSAERTQAFTYVLAPPPPSSWLEEAPSAPDWLAGFGSDAPEDEELEDEAAAEEWEDEPAAEECEDEPAAEEWEDEGEPDPGPWGQPAALDWIEEAPATPDWLEEAAGPPEG